MSTFDDLFQAKDDLYEQWNLTALPFAESAEKLQQLSQVFTGRRDELSQVINQFSSRDAKSILVYGWIGIGKTAFVREVLEGYDRNLGDRVLTASIKLEPHTDLATAALIALAREMPHDDWAQFQLNRLGLRPDRDLYNRTTTAGANMVFQGTVEEQRVNPEAPQFPNLSFEDLLERAMAKHDRVIIAIDDLDKQDPAVARQLLLNAQGLLKGRAWFLFTGHPSGITRDYLIRDRGLFDLALELGPLDEDTSYTMLKNYLASARRHPPDPDDEAAAVHPFTPATARDICRVAEGVPRWLNRMASYVLLKAVDLKAPQITPEVLQAGLDHARDKLKGQPGLTPQDYYVFEMVLERRILSDDTITLAELEQLKMEAFSEIMPILDKLVAADLLKRLPTERASAYAPMPLLNADAAPPAAPDDPS
ncbi:AAA family ATPase [Leptolyngbya iicbica]|uniref:ATP-binding protein n=2 Tax=Cyanophyceae TaxID=3028117 RepID=A0A4Q7E330_9CYAN|nr:ATP-binding protein [Leptolyngbya sp. LK]RZM75642.1 ATP-binding protein [Leptolyngbya sp. LK]